eukprot:scaffold72874_cov30-Tisochrysis_lutea.AAC.1
MSRRRKVLGLRGVPTPPQSTRGRRIPGVQMRAHPTAGAYGWGMRLRLQTHHGVVKRGREDVTAPGSYQPDWIPPDVQCVVVRDRALQDERLDDRSGWFSLGRLDQLLEPAFVAPRIVAQDGIVGRGHPCGGRLAHLVRRGERLATQHSQRAAPLTLRMEFHLKLRWARAREAVEQVDARVLTPKHVQPLQRVRVPVLRHNDKRDELRELVAQRRRSHRHHFHPPRRPPL